MVVIAVELARAQAQVCHEDTRTDGRLLAREAHLEEASLERVGGLLHKRFPHIDGDASEVPLFGSVSRNALCQT